MNSILGLIGEYSVTSACTQIEEMGKKKANSLKTDECIMVFDADHCSSSGSSIRLPAGFYPNLLSVRRVDGDFRNKIASFKQCANGPNSRITIYGREVRKYGKQNMNALLVRFLVKSVPNMLLGKI